MKNKKITAIAAITILLLIAGLYIGTIMPNKSSRGKTEYGVCIHIYQYDTSSTIQLLKQINATWVRIDWMPEHEKMNEFVQILKDNNISILVILDHNTMRNPDFTRLQWQETVQEIMSTEAAKKVDAWEIWNEPNADQFKMGYMNGNPQNYFEMLKDAHQIIEETSPNATILAAGLSPNEIWNDWLTDFANLSPQNYFDVQGVHIYDDVETNLNVLSETKEIIGKDIWVTEVGKPSGPSFEDFSPQDQASFLESNFKMLNEMKIPVFWYQLKDETYAFPPKETHFGLFDAQNNPKPASEAFSNFTSRP